MIYTKKEFGSELKGKLSEGNNYHDISKWAFKIYTDRGLEFEDGLDDFVLKLVAMEEGPEFVLSKEELKSIADQLLNREKE